jgi:hypothetical protein
MSALKESMLKAEYEKELERVLLEGLLALRPMHNLVCT